MFFEVLLLDEDFSANFAPDLLGLLSSWQFKQILISRKRLLLQLQLTFQHVVFFGLLFDFLLHLNGFFITMFVLHV